jgi:hypothetical protein
LHVRCGVCAFCSTLNSSYLRKRTRTHTSTVHCIHTTATQTFSISFSLVRTWAKLRTILSRGTCLFLHTGLSKSQLKTPTLTRAGPKPYVSYTISPHLLYHPSSSRTAFLPSIFKNHILGSSPTKRQRRLPITRPCCPPQRPCVSIKIDAPNYTPYFFSNQSRHPIYFVFLLFSEFFFSCLTIAPVITTAPSTPSSTTGTGGRASAKPHKNGALPSTHHQIPSYAAVLLSSTLGIITYRFFAAL